MSNTHQTHREQIISKINALDLVVEGKLSERKSRGKVSGIKLQRFRNGKNQTIHIPSTLVDLVQEGTENYQKMKSLFRELVLIGEETVFGDKQAVSKKSP